MGEVLDIVFPDCSKMYEDLRVSELFLRRLREHGV